MPILVTIAKIFSVIILIVAVFSTIAYRNRSRKSKLNNDGEFVPKPPKDIPPKPLPDDEYSYGWSDEKWH